MVDAQNHSVPGGGVRRQGQTIVVTWGKPQTGKKCADGLSGGENTLCLPIHAQGNGLAPADGDGGVVGPYLGSEGVRVTQVHPRFVQNRGRVRSEGGVGNYPVTICDNVGGGKNHLAQKRQQNGEGDAYRQQARQEDLSVCVGSEKPEHSKKLLCSGFWMRGKITKSNKLNLCISVMAIL